MLKQKSHCLLLYPIYDRKIPFRRKQYSPFLTTQIEQQNAFTLLNAACQWMRAGGKKRQHNVFITSRNYFMMTRYWRRKPPVFCVNGFANFVYIPVY